MGFTIGILNALTIHYYALIGFVLMLIYFIFLVYVLTPHMKNGYFLHRLCNGDEKLFNSMWKRTEIIIGASYILGHVGLLFVFQIIE